ncbi:putative ascorbate-specific transmembrane electron transporter 1-like [Capsicum annuum]|nr:putative ascorbate-specific transmembrane electron transporter 1-like [Capsicum annuum]
MSVPRWLMKKNESKLTASRFSPTIIDLDKDAFDEDEEDIDLGEDNFGENEDANNDSTWRKRRASRTSNTKKQIEEKSMELMMIPSHFKCPISLDLMKDPVTLSTGITYDRVSIESWIETGNQTCPITKKVLKSLEPIPNHTMRKMIQEWCVENKDHGIERIPTPRIPVTSSEVIEILRKVESCHKSQQGLESGRELVMKMRKMIKESMRNKRCFVTNGAGKILSSTLLVFSEKLSVGDSETMEEILSTLTVLLPLDGESKSILGSKSSLNCMIWLLKSGSLSSRRNSVFFLKEVMRMEEIWRVEELLKIDGALESLVKLVKEPICPTTTKASLLTIYHMIPNSPRTQQHKHQNQSTSSRTMDPFDDLSRIHKKNKKGSDIKSKTH